MIVGAGAIGGVVGGYLAKAGVDVLFVDQAKDHVTAMQQAGLTIQALDGAFNVPVAAVVMDDFVAEQAPLANVDAVFLAVKAQHTEEAITQFKHRLTEKTYVVSMQNGLCENIIASHIGESRTVGAFVNLFADYQGPGVIEYGGVGSMYIGEMDGRMTPRLEALHDVLLHWGNVQMTDNIWGYLWSKLAYGAVLTATALVDATMADVIDPNDNRSLLFALASEVLAVADKLHIPCNGFDDWDPNLVYPVQGRDEEALNESWDRLVLRLRSYKKVKSGIWRDLAVRKRKTEVPSHLVPVIEEGERLGLDMTLTKAVVQMIRDLEDGQRQMSWDNIEQLKTLKAGERMV
ncbi:ketopantoate reductase family protein [Alicyclobacillus fastidiosus]|uniref:2-dehydropantoate 2-reductase n=1 Tax=Alicyclobacillus fastidiosus TaxID=392011 RepID=A0ABV5AJU5_9BACL|nr:2-dehydropantoate 2-reductase [Alicyclobacillus fastidiosus]WEH12141.1 2-dehydropantoate 2-reductase [Alicyclobacillus fastidiosus]